MSKGFGGGGMPGNMKKMMQQAQKMQADLLKAQEEAKLETGDGAAGGGMVKVVADGSNKVVSIEINPEIVDPSDVEMLQDAILAAANAALENVQEKVQTKLSAITGGMQLPGL